MENHKAHRAPRSHGGGGVRDDCWSEGSTETLIEAWGDRHLKLNRGNLRQKDWKEVADAVNAGRNGVAGKPSRTDVQCKSRIDTLKKKYKLEKAKRSPSKWLFYNRLDFLIRPKSSPNTPIRSSTPAPSVHPSTAVTFTVKSKTKPRRNTAVYSGGSSRLNSSGSNESLLGGGDGDGGGGERDDDYNLVFGGGGLRKQIMDYMDFTEETAYKELARAILRFGEIYESIESLKQQQMMELEKQRMEFTKDLEFQRMNMFIEAQFEFEKMKWPGKYMHGAGKKL